MITRWSRYSRVKRVGALVLLVSILAIAKSSCSRDQADGSAGKLPRQASRPHMPGSGGPASRCALVQDLGDATPEGWVRSGEVEQYTPQNLYEKIDGLAELFLSYDVVGLTFASFVALADADAVLDVHVYDMGTPTNAFGVFSVERSPEEPPVDIGRAGYGSDANLYVWKGQYYLKIIASDTTDELAKAGMALAKKLAGSLADSGRQVWGRQAMPRADRVPRSLRYFQVDAMGLDFMRSTYYSEQ